MKNGLSVIIPVYNREKYIERLFVSILRLKIDDLEIIFVDDGSKESAALFLDEIAVRDSRVKVYHNKNYGPGYARNYGIEKSTKDYILFCDADDEIVPEAVDEMYDTIRENDLDIVIADYMEIFDSGKKNIKHYTVKYFLDDEEKRLDPCMLFDNIAVIGKIISKSFLLENQICFPNRYQAEDRVFLGKLSVSNPKFLWLDLVCYRYLRHESDVAASLTHSNLLVYYTERIDSWIDFYHICDGKTSVNMDLYMISRSNYLFSCWVHLDEQDKTAGIEATKKLACLLRSEVHEKNFFKMPLKQFLQISSYEDYIEGMISNKSQYAIKMHDDLNEPEISIIIPLYNNEKYLYKTLSTVLMQTYENYEVICVDDGSTDNTAEIVRQYMHFDKRIRLLQQENKSAGAARNKGMTIARGRYYLFLDGDDFFEPEMLEKAYNKTESEKAEVCVFSYQLYINKTKKPFNAAFRKEFVPTDNCFKGTDCKYIFNMTTANTWNKLFSRSFIDRYHIKFMEIRNCEDVYFVFLAMALADRITCLGDVLVNYRKTGNSLGSNIDNAPYCWYDSLVALKESLMNYGIYQLVEQSFMNFAISMSVHHIRLIKDEMVFAELYNKVKEEIYPELRIKNYDPELVYSYNLNNFRLSQNICKWRLEEFLLDDINKMIDKQLKANSDLKKKLDEQKKLVNKYKKDIANIKKSKSYKIGRLITWLPRKLRGQKK